LFAQSIYLLKVGAIGNVNELNVRLIEMQA